MMAAKDDGMMAAIEDGCYGGWLLWRTAAIEDGCYRGWLL